MKYIIIEDCSPYFVRFKCDGINNVISKSLKYIKKLPLVNQFIHYRYNVDQALDILTSVPMTEELNINHLRVSMFITPPKFYYRAHKDGLDHRYSLNYTVSILDDKYETNWYADEDLKSYKIDNLYTKTSRECVGFDKKITHPVKKNDSNSRRMYNF